MQVEIVVTAHTRWWLRLINWLGADMTWSHALLRFDDYIIEAAAEGVIKEGWNPAKWERYARFKLRPELLKEETVLQYIRMMAFAEGEVDKRYKYEALGAIAIRILKKIFGGQRGKYVFFSLIGTGEVCTSLVDRTWLFGGFDLVPEEKSPFVLPDEIAASKLLIEIKEDVESVVV